MKWDLMREEQMIKRLNSGITDTRNSELNFTFVLESREEFDIFGLKEISDLLTGLNIFKANGLFHIKADMRALFEKTLEKLTKSVEKLSKKKVKKVKSGSIEKDAEMEGSADHHSEAEYKSKN